MCQQNNITKDHYTHRHSTGKTIFQIVFLGKYDTYDATLEFLMKSSMKEDDST